MKKFGKLKLFGLLIFLSVALVFVGVNFLGGDKPDKPPGKPDKPGEEPEPEYTWNVTMPGSHAKDQDDNLYNHNLFGLPDEDADNTYRDENDRVHVIVEKKKRGKEYLLRLFIYHSVYDAQCIDLLYSHQIGFQYLDLVNVPHSQEGYYVVPEEYPCFFPNYYQYNTPDCYPEGIQTEGFWLGYDDNPRTGKVPGCMKHFLEVYPHPYCNIDCNIYPCTTDCPNCVYRNIDIRITVDHDIEKMGVGEIAHPTAEVWVEVDNYNELQTGLEDWHNISGLLRRDDSVGCVTITRSGPDTWEIAVDTIENPLFTFIEIYKGGWNNRWEYKIPYWTRTPFKFMTTWTRQEIE
jgi:hypothetical protein